MAGENYENFIAYRRSETKTLAERIYVALLERGYSTFLDISELGKGNFKEALPEVAKGVTNYLVIITDTSFDRCMEDEDDLFRKGIRHALVNKKNIVPILAPGFTRFPDQLPNDICEIKNQNGCWCDETNWDAFINQLTKRFLVDQRSNQFSDSERDFYIEGNVLVEYVGNASIVEIPEGIKEIGEYAFKDKTRITKITLPTGLVKISDGAFERCSNISSIHIPDTVVKVGNKAFSRCYKLAFVNMGIGVETIGDLAFSYCCKLKWVLIPEKVKYVTGSAFNGCSILERIIVEEANRYFKSQNGILYDYEGKAIIRCPENFPEDYIEILSTVKSIKPFAFFRCLNIQQINIPKNVEEIGECSFEGCCNISNMVLSGTVKKIDANAFRGWKKNQIGFSKDFSPVKRREIEKGYCENIGLKKDTLGCEFVYIKTTFESVEEARNMANMLLKFKYIVSGQIHQLESIYLWEQEINDEDEYELSCITIAEKCSYAIEFINANHSYETCQLLVVPIVDASKEIVDWMYESLEVIR